MFTAEVVVSLKPGVTDPEGANTKKALGLLGFANVHEVSTAKVFRLGIDAGDRAAAEKEAQEICRKLLANPVIHEFRVTVQENGR